MLIVFFSCYVMLSGVGRARTCWRRKSPDLPRSLSRGHEATPGQQPHHVKHRSETCVGSGGGVQIWKSSMAAHDAVEAIFEAVDNGDTAGVARMLDEDHRLLSTVLLRETPLMRAAERPSIGMVRLLLEKGAEVNFANSCGVAALHLAAMYGYDEVVSILLRSGADPSSRSISGTTPLYLASLYGHVTVVRVLLRHMRGRGVDERCNCGCTALWMACCIGHVEVVRVLLLAGADHNIADNDGYTPLQKAEQHEKWECVAVIQEWERELQRTYVLHKARSLHEGTATRHEVPAAPVPAYLRPRADKNTGMPHVEIVDRDSTGGRVTRDAVEGTHKAGGEEVEREKDAMVVFVVKDLAAELYTELMAGVHH